MTSATSLSDILQNLLSLGYQLADATQEALPDESFRSDDWRLDSVYSVKDGTPKGAATLVVAVSSASRQMKLVFIEVLVSIRDFSPMTLLRRLFPMKARPTSTLGLA